MKHVALFLCPHENHSGFGADLERELTEAKGGIAALQKTVESLSTEVQALRQPDTVAPVAALAVVVPSKEADRKPPDAARLSFDYQLKNHPSFEDDAVNGRFQITWGILLK